MRLVALNGNVYRLRVVCVRACVCVYSVFCVRAYAIGGGGSGIVATQCLGALLPQPTVKFTIGQKNVDIPKNMWYIGGEKSGRRRLTIWKKRDF